MLPVVVGILQGCGVESPIQIHPNHATCDPQIPSPRRLSGQDGEDMTTGNFPANVMSFFLLNTG